MLVQNLSSLWPFLFASLFSSCVSCRCWLTDRDSRSRPPWLPWVDNTTLAAPTIMFCLLTLSKLDTHVSLPMIHALTPPDSTPVKLTATHEPFPCHALLKVTAVKIATERDCTEGKSFGSSPYEDTTT